MKKLIIGLLLVCVLVALAVTFTTPKIPAPATTPVDASAQAEPAAAEEAAVVEEVTAEDAAAEAAEATAEKLDYEAMLASHDPDEVVMVTEGYEVTWKEFSYWAELIGEECEYYIEMYKLYGYDAKWSDFDAGNVESVVEQLKAERAVELLAEEYGVTLTEEELATSEEEFLAAVESQFGEATEENINEYLAVRNLTRELMDRYNRVSLLYPKLFAEIYGENGEKATDEDTLAYIEEQGYLNANHILFMTIDASTYEDLDDATKAEKEAKAKEIAAELQAITDREELLARFAELKQELDEDSGKVSNPDGYLFTSGQMVEEFENGTLALEPYQVSDPILSTYGYHVILRLPVEPDTVMSVDEESGEPITPRMLFASNKFSEDFQAKTAAVECEKKPAVENFTYLDFVTVG